MRSFYVSVVPTRVRSGVATLAPVLCASIALAVFLPCVSSRAVAQPDGTASYRGAIREALARSSRLALLDRQTRVASAAASGAAALPDPMLRTQIWDVPFDLSQAPEQMMFMIEQQFPLGAEIDAEIGMARADAQMLSTEASMARRMLALEVGLAYASYAESSQLLRLGQERVRAVELLLESMNVSGTASTAGGAGGMGSASGGSRLLTELASMRVELAMARAEREDMIAMRDETRGMLAALLKRGADDLGEAALPQRLHEVEITRTHVARFIERAAAMRPELELAELEAARTLALDSLNNARDLPMLAVGGGVMWMPRHSHTSAMIEVSVSLPISRSARDARRTEHSLRRDLARATEAATSEQIAREISEFALAAARLRVRAHGLRETVLPSALEAVTTAQAEGSLDLDPSRALQALMRVVEVRMDLARAEGELFRALVRLENAVGEPLEILEDLQ